MRRAVLLIAAAVLLLVPTVLAFFSGGYFDEPRLIATLVTWGLVLVVALVSRTPLPSSLHGRIALAGLAVIAAWTGISLAWAPLSEPATANVVRVLLYLGALVAAIALLRDRLAARAVEPVLAFGTVVVIGYGLAGRLLPGIVQLAQSAKADGRLEQPITYWNAEGALAAIGFVLCVRLAGTDSRPVPLRAVAASACALLGLGVYLSFSRGAIAAAVVGLIVLLAAAPSWSQLRSAGIAVAAGVVVALACAGFPGVASLEGSIDQRETDGAIALAILVAVMLAAGFAQWWACRAERDGRAAAGQVPHAGRLPALAAVVVVIGLAGLVAGGLGERGEADELSRREGAARLTSVESRRYDYWRVGLESFARHPFGGVGAAGFRVEWVRDRPVAEPALEVHSLPLEMATELGIPGVLGLVMLVGGVGLAGVAALRREPALAPGACAAATVWALHATIDWDWQIPAVTLPAIVLGGALIAAGEDGYRTLSPSRAGSAA
jgi:O-Antigen ligase